MITFAHAFDWMENEMAQQDEFKENTGIFLNDRESRVDIDAFTAFVEENGVERAKGYLQAIKDLHPFLETIALGHKVGDAQGTFQAQAYFITDANSRKKAEELFKHMESLLEWKSSNGSLLNQIFNSAQKSDVPSP